MQVERVRMVESIIALFSELKGTRQKKLKSGCNVRPASLTLSRSERTVAFAVSAHADS